MSHTWKSILLFIIKRIIEIGVVAYLITTIHIFIFGGFKTSGFIKVSATTPLNPVVILFLLLIVRIVIVLQKKDAALLIGSVCFCLVSIEIFLRAWNPFIAKPALKQIHQASSVYSWELIPNARGVGRLGEAININSHGYRGAELLLSNTAERCRIMAIGDSFTFGMGVNSEATYAKQLEAMLNKRQKKCEVINSGVIGYRMWQNYEVLKHKAPLLKPDLIILGVFLNDILQIIPPYIDNPDWKPVVLFEKKKRKKFVNNFYLYNFAHNLDRLYQSKYRYRDLEYLAGIEKRKNWFKPTHDWYKIMYGLLDHETYSLFSKTLSDFVETARGIESNVLVLMIPDAAQMHDKERQHINRYVKSECDRLNVPYIDATHAFETEADTNSLYLFPADAHISPKGYRIIADLLYEKVVFQLQSQ